MSLLWRASAYASGSGEEAIYEQARINWVANS
jgi:hypothetical protein